MIIHDPVFHPSSLDHHATILLGYKNTLLSDPGSDASLTWTTPVNRSTGSLQIAPANTYPSDYYTDIKKVISMDCHTKGRDIGDAKIWHPEIFWHEADRQKQGLY
eukprot:scaffold39684_cov70-Attheya_sp.AAC.2